METIVETKNKVREGIVRILPIDKDRPHGLSMAKFPGSPKTIVPMIGRDRKFRTGLTLEEEQEFTAKYGLDYSKLGNAKEPHPVWSSHVAEVELKMTGPTIFNLSIDDEYIKYKICLNSPRVANSLKGWEEYDFPHATHYIENIQEQQKDIVNKHQILSECYQLLSEATLESKINAVLIIEDVDLTGSSNNKVIPVLAGILKKAPGRLLEVLQQDKTVQAATVIIKRCILHNILTREGNRIKYEGGRLADTEVEAVAHISKPANQLLFVKLESKLNEFLKR